jgi:hypothetical protein
METRCSCCGQPLPDVTAGDPSAVGRVAVEIPRADEARPVVEFDHRGVPLPARTRVGGIIIPQ